MPSLAVDSDRCGDDPTRGKQGSLVALKLRFSHGTAGPFRSRLADHHHTHRSIQDARRLPMRSAGDCPPVAAAVARIPVRAHRRRELPNSRSRCSQTSIGSLDAVGWEFRTYRLGRCDCPVPCGEGGDIHGIEWRATFSALRWIFSANVSVTRAAARKTSCVDPYCGSAPCSAVLT